MFVVYVDECAWCLRLASLVWTTCFLSSTLLPVRCYFNILALSLTATDLCGSQFFLTTHQFPFVFKFMDLLMTDEADQPDSLAEGPLCKYKAWYHRTRKHKHIDRQVISGKA